MWIQKKVYECVPDRAYDSRLAVGNRRKIKVLWATLSDLDNSSGTKKKVNTKTRRLHWHDWAILFMLAAMEDDPTF